LEKNRPEWNRISEALRKGVEEGVFPGALALVGRAGKVAFLGKSGYRSLVPEKALMHKDTIFDIASLTKPRATTLATMKLVHEGKVSLDQPLAEIIGGPLGEKENLTLRLLLCHSAGFADWKPYYMELVKYGEEQRKKVVRELIIQEPFAYTPGKGCLYSDLGFMILEWVIEKAAGESLKHFVEKHFYGPLGLKRTFFAVNSSAPKYGKEQFAAAEECAWRGRVILGEVQDENAFSLGGFSGHAGLFGSAEEVFAVANLLREHYLGLRDDFFSPYIVREFFTRQDIVKNSTWALGWDTPSQQDSSSGKYFSGTSVGHLGFTGTSLWMDLEKDVVVVLLTNRVHPTRNNQKIKAFRPLFHDIIMREIGAA